MRYAERTAVPVERSRAEIEHILTRYGADSFGYLYSKSHAQIVFRAKNRTVRFELPLPQREKYRSAAHFEQESRRCWRAMALAIKSKLEVVASGIATFEEEFLAHIVLPNNETLGANVAPLVAQAYESGKMPPTPLLALPSP